MSFQNVWIWVASYHTEDDQGTNLMSSSSLLELQNYVIKKVEKAVKRHNKVYFGEGGFEYIRERNGNNITFVVRYKNDGDVFEWYTIKRVRWI